MTTRLADLVAILEVHGSNSENWPASSRVAMEDFVANSAEARQAVAEAAELDRCLDVLGETEPAPDLAARILADLPERPSRSPIPLRRGAMVALPLAAAAVVALWLGLPTEQPALPTPVASSATVLVMDTEAFDWEMPSDVLLHVASLDPMADVPEYGCLYDEQECLGSTDNRESSLLSTSRNLT